MDQVGVAANSDRPKELSSFQSFPSNQAWSSIEKVGSGHLEGFKCYPCTAISSSILFEQ